MENLEFVIESSQRFSELKTGNYHTTFVGITEIETSKGKALRWEFRCDSGEIISGLSDNNGAATPNNKTGRWLAALANQSLTSGSKISPINYVGKKYLVIVQNGGNGKPAINTFTALA